jgi:gliding motility-associated-like protein
LACYQTATWNPTTCIWDITGTQPAAPTGLACYQTSNWNPTTCIWDVTGTQPAAPTGLACYQTAAWNPTTCIWDITGTQPVRNIAVASQCNNDSLLSVVILDLINTDFPGVSTVTGTWSVSPATSGLNTATGEFIPFGLPSGNYVVSYNNNDLACPGIVIITIPVDDTCIVLACGNIIVHNAFSPNNDGLNEIFTIENLENRTCYPTNKVEIYNRWGELVYENKNYDNDLNAFKGISEGQTTIKKSDELPTGTYFYLLEFTDDQGKNYKKDGYLYLSR